MRRILVFAMSLLLAAGMAFSMPAPADAAESNIYDQDGRPHTLGSAEYLAGDVYVLSCFVSDSENQWTESERMEMIALMYEAQNWLEDQASEYGVALAFENYSFGLEQDIELDAVPSMREEGAKKMVSTVLKEVGCRSSLDFYNVQKSKSKFDNLTVLIFVKGSGASYALPYADQRADMELYYTEGAVIFREYSTVDVKRPAGAIAHEILHTFGAWELYNVYYHKNDIETLAHELFPDSIMHAVRFDINDSTIDEVTAWRIGWHDKKQPWYEHFDPGISDGT